MKHNLIIYTDIGDDVDDLLAIWFADQSDLVEHIFIVLSGHEYEKRHHTRSKTVPYMTKKHSVFHGNNISNDEGLKILLAGYNNSLYDILCIGPATEFARHLKTGIIKKDVIRSCTIQAGYDPLEHYLDLSSRNTKIDTDAMKYITESGIAISRIGKYAAYDIGLSRDRFHTLVEKDTNRGGFLLKQAQHWQDIFKKINPPVYEKIYGNSPDILSYPYDLVAVLSILYPSGFFWQENDKYRSIGYEQGLWIDDSIYTLLSVNQKNSQG